jgi:hypothetical protein
LRDSRQRSQFLGLIEVEGFHWLSQCIGLDS